ncbi:MAG: hypothetical protein WCF85_21730, partial [Rhodospirillaceae bacterium]
GIPLIQSKKLSKQTRPALLATFTATPLWRARSAELMPPIETATLPTSLLERFGGDPGKRLMAFLAFLGPLTGGASWQQSF